jgi:hypothetical protein
MTMTKTKTASLDELRAMKKRGELSPTKPDAKGIDLPDGFWESSVPDTNEREG